MLSIALICSLCFEEVLYAFETFLCLSIDHSDAFLGNSCNFLLQAARMRFIYENEPYCLNLIDTPGHVDFSYEVCGRNGLNMKVLC